MNIAGTASPARELPDWNLLRSFVAVVDTGTLTGAAERLGSTQPSVGRHIRTLEKSLGETLFKRLPGRLIPTDRGQALYEVAARMRDAAREIAQGVDQSAPQAAKGTVRITTGEVLGVRVLPQLLAPLLTQEPSLEIELVVSNATDNLRRREADIAVRFYKPTQEDLIAMPLGTVDIGLYAHRDLLARLPTAPRLSPSLPDLGTACLIGYDQMPMDAESHLRGPKPTQPLHFRFRTDAILAQQAAVLHGLGIGSLWVGVARDNPAMVRVLPDQVAITLDVWLCAHDELRRSRRMRVVWDHLAATLPPWLASLQAPLQAPPQTPIQDPEAG